MSSPQKRRANRANAKKSTGPKTVAGKARSSRNAVTHGLTAEPDAAEAQAAGPSPEFRHALGEWVGELRPRGVVECTLAERACRAAWRLGQCDRYEDAAAARRDRVAPYADDRELKRRIEGLGRELLAGPPRRSQEDQDDRRSRRSGRSARRVEPEPDTFDAAALRAELESTAEGVDWLLARWAELGRALKVPGGGWDEAEELAVVGLLGLRPEAMAGHPLLPIISPPSDPNGFPNRSVFEFEETHRVIDEIEAAGARGEGSTQEMFARYVAALYRRGRIAAGLPVLGKRKALIRRERARLARLRPRGPASDPHADRLLASSRAMFDDPKTLSLLVRYSTAASRDLHRSLRDLTALRKAGEGDGDAPGPEPLPPAPGPEGSPPSPLPCDAPPSNWAPRARISY